MVTPTQIVQDVKNGIKTTEFYLASFVVFVGTVDQFLPKNVASTADKVAGFVAIVLAALGYTISRTVVKTNSNS